MRDNSVTFQSQLLEWYDAKARVLPWRVSPSDRTAGVQPDPYRVWMSEIMLQQTTVAAVKAYFVRFTTLWPTVGDLARAEDDRVMAEWAGLGYYARARNLLKCARVVADEWGGVFPRLEAELLTLPGIGPYTAATVSAIAYDAPSVVMDGNVERVMARQFAVVEPLPDCKPVLKGHAAALTPIHRSGDYAQAVMDLGATICTPRSPSCGVCPVAGGCKGRLEGLAAELPRKRRKPAKPIRYGIAYVAFLEDGSVVLERRPEKGLLGGMMGWPGTDWAEAPSEECPPFPADWQDTVGEIRHTFTHFHLRLQAKVAHLPSAAVPKGYIGFSSDEFDPTGLPTVMRKVWDLV